MRAPALALALAFAITGARAAAPDCGQAASAECFFAFEPPAAGGRLNYYASSAPGEGAPTAALIVLHGHPRDANRSFDAAWRAVQGAGAAARTLVVAPVFQVATEDSARCRTAGVPAPRPGDLLWTCASWLDGGPATNGSAPGSFAVLDALVAEVLAQWPGVRTVTVAGFSAGAQMLQRAIGLAANAPAGVTLRYVVADPGSWLYFDPVRPQPKRGGAAAAWADCGGADVFPGDCTFELAEPADAGACPALNRWKYGIADWPATFGRSAAEARAHYAAAEVQYLEGALDSGSGRGTAATLLDKSCAAMAQGDFRLQRGVAYAAYDRALLAPTQQRRVTVVPGCAHDVACVFPSPAARSALFGTPR